jgi:hypothetical protein
MDEKVIREALEELQVNLPDGSEFCTTIQQRR